MRTPSVLKSLFAAACATFTLAPQLAAEPLKIAYSDWPGWVVWQIGIDKGWFKEAGVEADFKWYDYASSTDAYATGAVDGFCVTNGDALTTAATGKPSVIILINDYSSGNDMILAKAGINSFKDLKGKKVALERGFVEHLLLLKGLEKNGMAETDVTIVNTPTSETPPELASGSVQAIGVWQPITSQAMKAVPDAKPLITSAEFPGLIYDVLAVSPESLQQRREDWVKVAKVWYRIVDYMRDPANKEDILKILSSRVKMSPSEFGPLLEGVHLLDLAEATKAWQQGDGLDSIYGSCKLVNEFNLQKKVYAQSQDIQKFLDPSVTEAAAK